MTDVERRTALANSAKNSFERISKEVLETLLDSATAATVVRGEHGDWVLLLGRAKLALNRPVRNSLGRGIPSVSWGTKPAPFEVVSAAVITLTCGSPVRGYRGRSHSLWYGDVQNESQFGWYETAFMDSVWTVAPEAIQSYESPYGLSPTDKAVLALTTNTATQLAWPFMELDVLDLSEFVDRWAAWLAAASEGNLQAPSEQPERPPRGSWRMLP
ncbi:hypothetical protein AHiyo6_02310 [Arthrobacter sp. Hiyo6]|nr:hypothetical protein AHiyo6_02310 [Arthrobacter sp. Hiyo6]